MLKANLRDPREILPGITWEKIAPPYRDYHYFHGAAAYPFRPHVSTFDMVNAWWLIEASTLAYADKDFARKKFQQAGLSEVAFFTGASTQCYVAHNDDFLFLVFRGTEIRSRPGQSGFDNIIADLVTDADFRLVDSGQGGKVHRGFKEALDEVWEKAGLLDYLRRKDSGGRTIWFTGHSLGAALATLAASRYGNLRGLYTYGSPRVGDRDFKKEFPSKTYRFKNHRDPVTRVPPPFLYEHVGELKYIDSQGLIHDQPFPEENVLNAAGAEVLSALDSLKQMRAGVDALIPKALVDHVPTLYATHIWNNIP
jgi:hypothetical protein